MGFLKNCVYLYLALMVFLSCDNNKKLKNGMYAEIKTDKGDILVELFYKKVPMTVANFVALSQGNHPSLAIDELKGKPYYDGLKFHRVIPNFMIQGGDFLGTGTGDLGYQFPDEFPRDSTGKLIYLHLGPGVLSMANSGPGTNGAQFFITHNSTPHLDEKHTVFGRVIQGQNVVNSIDQDDVIKKVSIIPKGIQAKEFNAPIVFQQEYEKISNQLRKEKEANESLFEEKKNAFMLKMHYANSKLADSQSGLRIYVEKKGTGPKVNLGDTVEVNYSGYLEDGTLFDTSEKTGRPFIFKVGVDNVIQGWKEGISLMREKEKAILFIPHYLAYGQNGIGDVIPPKSNLVFEVEILKVLN